MTFSGDHNWQVYPTVTGTGVTSSDTGVIWDESQMRRILGVALLDNVKYEPRPEIDNHCLVARRARRWNRLLMFVSWLLSK